jgi:type II secretory ATPase GspE/PulE/Tfp pilus assembly ATPase PilB-like protein
VAQTLEERVAQLLAGLEPGAAQYAVEVVERILCAGRALGASDLHLQPEAQGLALRFRIDGVLHPAAVFPASVAPNLIARLKVCADLLTYRTDVPQEGRIRSPDREVEMRVSTFPTIHGEKAVVRFFGGASRYQRLDDLGLPEDVLDPLRRLLGETSGAILATGPAGSGKTTTVYACLREVAAQSAGQRSLVSIEDPVEVAIPGVAQSQVNPAAQFDLATGLRFLMRQDPEVILVGEIRDRATAEAALQASLTGHLLLSTFHAGSAAEAIGRLSDMGIEPYLLRSGVRAILSQRLLRRLCGCARWTDDPHARLGLPVDTVRIAVGCPRCGGTGYQGRFVLVEMLMPEPSELGRAILSRLDAATLERLAIEAGMKSRWQRGCEAVRAGLTSPAELRRTLGFGNAL